MMYVKFVFKTFNLFVLSVFILLLSSCNNGSATSVKLPPVKTIAHTVNQDSINKILKEIHADEKAILLDAVFNNEAKHEGFNGCVLIAQRGQIIYRNVFGYSNIKTKEPLKLNSVFQLSSSSKPLTAAAIMLLMEQGKLKLTDDVQKYLPQFPYQNITIQMLLTHRSGLSNYVYDCEPYCEKPNLYNGSPFNNKSMLEILTEKKPPMYYVPGKKFEYCNTNYALLPLIVEKASGMSFADFMKKNIFEPLGMNDTWVHDVKTDSLHKNVTTGHDASGRLQTIVFADDVVGDKGIYSTIDDMFKWDQALYSDKIMKKETIEQSFAGYSNEHKGKRNYGYGWRMTDEGKNNKIVYHNGWWHGYNSEFFRRLNDQTTIIILSNKDNRMAYKIKDVLPILNNNSEAVDVVSGD